MNEVEYQYDIVLSDALNDYDRQPGVTLIDGLRVLPMGKPTGVTAQKSVTVDLKSPKTARQPINEAIPDLIADILSQVNRLIGGNRLVVLGVPIDWPTHMLTVMGVPIGFCLRFDEVTRAWQITAGTCVYIPGA